MPIELPDIETTPSELPSYLTVEQADALAGSLPGLPAFKAADADAKLAALVQASSDIDSSQRWQGRKYDVAQALEFPRIDGPLAAPDGSNVIDWDGEEQIAIVPRNIKLACLYQADGILAGVVGERVDRDPTLASQSIGPSSESYRPATEMSSSGAVLLVTRAAELIRRYRLRSGRIL